MKRKFYFNQINNYNYNSNVKINNYSNNSNTTYYHNNNNKLIQINKKFKEASSINFADAFIQIK